MATITEKLAETLKRIYNIEISEGDLERLYAGEPLGEVLGITDAQLNQFEQLGYEKLEKKEYQDAYDIFVFLLSLQPENPRLHVSAGHAMLYMQQFQSAIQHYFLSMQIDVDYLPAYLGAALAQAGAGDVEAAYDTLTSGLLIAVDNDDEESIQSIADLYRELGGEDESPRL